MKVLTKRVPRSISDEKKNEFMYAMGSAAIETTRCGERYGFRKTEISNAKECKKEPII